jgi:hypothetical protein
MNASPRGIGKRYYFPGVVWLLALGFLLQAHTFSAAAAAVPLLIGWTTLALTSIDLITRMRQRPPESAAEVPGTDARVPATRVVVAISGVVLLVAGMTLVGILPTVPVFILIALRWGGGRGLTTSVVTALILTGLLWSTFGALMRLDLYPGLLFGGDW